jgi:GTPase
LKSTHLQEEKAVLVGLSRDSRRRAEHRESLRELEELTRSAGARVLEVILQEREEPDSATFIGKGKVEQIGRLCRELEADLVVFDEELSPVQQRNLESALEIKVVDRSELILDIFAQRARSREGKLQVELAQLEYRIPRLTGKGAELSRLGGGIGTRGPGETKLEADRRTIRDRISRIREELRRLEQRRGLHRRKRRAALLNTVSLVGYTNAGKSTLFNRLTSADTYVSNRLFATLDPLVRKVELPTGYEVLFSDTVGFVRKLPHSLVAAFHATLEETKQADLILHVIDASQENFERLRAAVYEVLEEIGVEDVPVIEVYNKIDLLEHLPAVGSGFDGIYASALSGEGIPDLLNEIEETLGRRYRKFRLLIPFDRGDVTSHLRRAAQILSEEYRPDGVLLEASLPAREWKRFRRYLIEPSIEEAPAATGRDA